MGKWREKIVAIANIVLAAVSILFSSISFVDNWEKFKREYAESH
jgi:hypothetical protein